MKAQINKSKDMVIKGVKESKAEEWLLKAHYPLGLNGIRYYLIAGGLVIFLSFYYVILPIIINGETPRATLIAAVVILLTALLLAPNHPVSLFVYFMKKVIEYNDAQKHAEIFMLYDLLINEIEMMSVVRINTYSILRNIKPYFVVLEKPMTLLLSSWSNDQGPQKALDTFSISLSSKEGQALIGVMKNLDDIDKETALHHLRGMHSMFVKTQIETYRRKRKVTTDLLGIPIKATHFVILLNFLMVIVTMVSFIMKTSRM
jgi:hypothetical protein